MAKFGGGVALCSFVFTSLFPRRYEKSALAATYDQRTLLGQTSAQTDPSIDPVREKHGTWAGANLRGFWGAISLQTSSVELQSSPLGGILNSSSEERNRFPT